MTTLQQLNEMSASEFKVFENRMRRVAARQGFTLVKSRSRDPRASDWCKYLIVDARTGNVETGEWNMSLTDVEQYLTENSK